MPFPIAAIAATLLPYLPTIGKAVLGWLPPNATAVVNKVVDVAKQGLSIGQPIVNTLSAIAGNTSHVDGPEQAAPDISVSSMAAALAELNEPGTYESALAAAKAAPEA